MKPLQLAIPQLRRGKMGSMPLGADYMEGVAKRAARMERACRTANNPKNKEGLGDKLKNNYENNQMQIPYPSPVGSGEGAQQKRGTPNRFI